MNRKARKKPKKVQARPRSDTWILIPPTDTPLEPRVYPPERDEGEIKLACELSLLFALLFWDRSENADSSWWLRCQLESFKHPMGSYSNVFWWSMRILGNPAETLDSFRSYLEWKWNEFELGRIPRDGPRWL